MTSYTFQNYWDAGIREIIPILPPDAVIDREFGSMVADLHRGKIPGKYKPRRKMWVGYDGWTEVEITESMISTWDEWPNANIGLRSARWPGTDFDITSDTLRASFVAFARKFWGQEYADPRASGIAACADPIHARSRRRDVRQVPLGHLPSDTAERRG